MVKADSATIAWLKSVEYVMDYGITSYPRQIETKEVLNAPITFDMKNPVVHHHYRNLNYSFMAAEAYWITSGSPLVEDIAPYNKHIAQFSDDGYIFNGAYGPAFLSQVNFVIDTLLKDPWSRQAVMTIWHPNPVDTKDHKCTVALAFCIRDNELHTTVFMRSNDLWLGRPYDMFNFSVMSMRVLCGINKKFSGPSYRLGNCTLHAVNSHIYGKDFEQIGYMLDNPNDFSIDTAMPLGNLTDWNYIANSLLACRDGGVTKNLWEIRPCD